MSSLRRTTRIRLHYKEDEDECEEVRDKENFNKREFQLLVVKLDTHFNILNLTKIFPGPISSVMKTMRIRRNNDDEEEQSDDYDECLK
jgi:hypothetical protein